MALIEDYIKKDELSWGNLFYAGAISIDYLQDTELKPIIDFLCNKVSFWYYKDFMEENPFYPFTVFSTGRSADIKDFNSEDILSVKNCLQYSQNNLILGFLHDILGLIKKDNNEKLIAANYFIEHAKEMAQNEEHLGLVNLPLKRAFGLFFLTKNEKEISNLINTIFGSGLFQNHKNELYFKLENAKLICQNHRKSQRTILPYLEALYERHKNELDTPVDSMLELSKFIFGIYKDWNNKEQKEKWLKVYAEHCCSMKNFTPDLLNEFDNAIAELNNIDFALQNELRFKRQEMQKMFSDSLNKQSFNISLGEEMEKECNAQLAKICENLQNLDSIGQFCYFLQIFSPLSKTEIKRRIEDKKAHAGLVDVFNKICLNDENEIIFQSNSATLEQKEEYDTAEIYSRRNAIAFDFILHPYICYAKVDDDFSGLLKDIVEHNLLVQKDNKTVLENLLRGFNKNIRSALTILLPQFEESCRLYIKSQNIFPSILKGGKEFSITLAEIFNYPQFRTPLDKLLGEDLTQAIDFLTCKPLGAKIRNKIAHKGLGDDNQVTPDELTLFFLLVNAYCLAYEN